MAISPMYFQVLSPDQANPFGYGMRQGAATMGQMLQNASAQQQLPYAGPTAAARLQGLNIGNALQQNTLNYAPQMSQADLLNKNINNGIAQNTLNYAPATSQANINNTNAQTGYYGSSSQKNIADAGLINQQKLLYMYSVADPATKLLLGRQIMLNGGFPQNSGNAQSPAQQSYGQPMPQQGVPQQAMQQPQQPAYGQPGVSGLPSGIPMRPSAMPNNMPAYMQQQGQPANGMPQQQQGAPSFSNIPMQIPSANDLYSTLINNQIKGMGKDPRFGSGRGGAGGTYIDPTTGQAVSTNTERMNTTDQSSIAAVQRVSPIIDDLMDKMPQFQTAKTQGKLRLQGASNYLFGTDYPLPSQYAAGEADLNKAAEGLVKGWGLNPTDETLNMMKETIKGVKGESPRQYKTRLIGELNQLTKNQTQSGNRLANGTQVGNSAPLPITDSKILNGATYHKINGKWYAQ